MSDVHESIFGMYISYVEILHFTVFITSYRGMYSTTHNTQYRDTENSNCIRDGNCIRKYSLVSAIGEEYHRIPNTPKN
jgi:hypothetical protein